MERAAPTIFTASASKSSLVNGTNGWTGGSGNQGVATNLENTNNSIGYVEYSYVLLNKSLDSAFVVNKSGVAVDVNADSIAAAAATKPTVSSVDFSIVNPVGKTAYPISGYSWVMLRKVQDAAATSLAQAELTVKLVDWLAHNAPGTGVTLGQDVAASQGYVALPVQAQTVTRNALKTVTYNGAVVLK